MTIDLQTNVAGYFEVSPFRDEATIDGGPDTISGKFVNAHRGDAGVEASRPTFNCAQLDITANGLTRATTLTIGGVVYRCQEFRESSTGATLISLDVQ